MADYKPPHRPFADQCAENLDVVMRWKGKIPDAALWWIVCGLLELIRKYRGRR